jgi:hypothetical protein
MPEPDEHALLRDRERAQQAEHLINNELFQESFAYLEAAYMKAWRNTGIADADTIGRERLWQAINLLDKVRDHLRTVIERGKLSKRQIEEIEEKRRRLRAVA